MKNKICRIDRRAPKQQRSKETVDAIVAATAQILVEQGYDRLTTNRVAKVAGVSVGSLYQYFRDKHALVEAVIERHIEFAIDLLQTTAADLAAAPVATAVRTYVREILAFHAQDPALNRVVTQLAMQLGPEHIVEHNTRLRQLVWMYLSQHQAELVVTNLELAAFVVVNMVESTVHTALLPGRVGWTPAQLEQEIGDAVLRYLVGRAD